MAGTAAAASLKLGGIFQPTSFETKVAEELRRVSVEEIESRGNTAEIAKQFDVAPVGLRALLRRKRWDLETAFRAADLLQIDVGEVIRNAA